MVDLYQKFVLYVFYGLYKMHKVMRLIIIMLLSFQSTEMQKLALSLVPQFFST